MSSSSSSSSLVGFPHLPKPLFANSKTATGCKSWHGITVNNISSVLQKTIRRGAYLIAMAYTLEWLSFTQWGNTERAQVCLSNMRNRVLCVIPFEDVLAFAEIPLVDRVHKLFKTLEKDKKNIRLADTESIKVELIDLVRKQCLAKKCRIGSFLRHFFGYESYRLFPKEWNCLIDATDASTLQTEPFLSGIKASVRASWSFQEDWKTYTEKDVPMIQWWQTFFFVFGSKEVNEKNKIFLSQAMRDKQLDARKQFWARLLERAKNQKSTEQEMGPIIHTENRMANFVSQCKDFFMSRPESKENFLFPLHAMLGVNHRYNKHLELFTTEKWYYKVSDESMAVASKFYSSALPPMPDYALYDMHTPEGKAAGMGPREFATEGSKVIPENTEFLIVQWKDMYMQYKIKQAEDGAALKALKGTNKRKHVVVSPVPVLVVKDEDETEEEDASSDEDEEEEKEKKAGSDSDSDESMFTADPIKLDLKISSTSSTSSPKPKRQKRNPTSHAYTDLPFPLDGTISSRQINSWKTRPLQVLLFQKTTTGSKQITFIFEDVKEGDPIKVYKGPFSLNVGATYERMIRFQKRYAFFKAVGIQVASTHLCAEEGEPGRLWLSMDYLGSRFSDTKPLERIEGNKIYESIIREGTWKGVLIHRASCGVLRAKDVLMETWLLNVGYRKALKTVALYLLVRACMSPSVGDTGFQNLLVTTHETVPRVFMVDFEENMTRDIDTNQILGPANWDQVLNHCAMKRGERDYYNHLMGIGANKSRHYRGKFSDKKSVMKSLDEPSGNLNQMWKDFLKTVKDAGQESMLNTTVVSMIDVFMEAHVPNPQLKKALNSDF